MKTRRLETLLAVILLVFGLVVSVYAGSGEKGTSGKGMTGKGSKEVTLKLDPHGFGEIIVKDAIPFEKSGGSGSEEFVWTRRYNPEGMATIWENDDHTVAKISIAAKGLPGSCEYLAYLVDPEANKIYGVGDDVKGYAFATDEKGSGRFSFDLPFKSAYDPLPMMGIHDWPWKTLDIHIKPGCIGEYTQLVLSLNLRGID